MWGESRERDRETLRVCVCESVCVCVHVPGSPAGEKGGRNQDRLKPRWTRKIRAWNMGSRRTSFIKRRICQFSLVPVDFPTLGLPAEGLGSARPNPGSMPDPTYPNTTGTPHAFCAQLEGRCAWQGAPSWEESLSHEPQLFVSVSHNTRNWATGNNAICIATQGESCRGGSSCLACMMARFS